MKLKDTIYQKLVEQLQISYLHVEDESHLHAGHGDWEMGAETHFRVTIASPLFQGKNKLQQHRMIHKVLEQELNSGVHALAIKTLSN